VIQQKRGGPEKKRRAANKKTHFMYLTVSLRFQLLFVVVAWFCKRYPLLVFLGSYRPHPGLDLSEPDVPGTTSMFFYFLRNSSMVPLFLFCFGFAGWMDGWIYWLNFNTYFILRQTQTHGHRTVSVKNVGSLSFFCLLNDIQTICAFAS